METKWKELNPKKVMLKLTDGTQITGDINVDKDFRVSDMFTKTEEPFLVIFNASMMGQTGKVAICNKNHIIFAIPRD